MKKETILKHLPLIAVVLGAAILAIAFFMPFGSATEDYAEGLNSYPDEFYAEEIGMKNRSAVNLSLLEYARLYGYGEDVTLRHGEAAVLDITALESSLEENGIAGAGNVTESEIKFEIYGSDRNTIAEPVLTIAY